MITGSQKLWLSLGLMLLGWLIYFALADGKFQFYADNSPFADAVLSVLFSSYVIFEGVAFLINVTELMENNINSVRIIGPISAIPTLIFKITKWANKNL